MFNISLTRRSRAVLIASTAAIGILATPPTAAAEPHATHVALEKSDETDELLDACPVEGPSMFEDSWGWARSGGRSHEGVDLIADRGTPIVAVRDGDAEFKQNRLGGNAVWLTAPNGDKFYYAHLDGFAGESRSVEAGELIGYVGSTGNARGAHLHFETLPAGDVENPYPHTVAACVPTAEELEAIAQHRANELNDPAVWARFLPQD